MKKIFKSRLFLCVIVGICCLGIGVYAGAKYQASDVLYNPSSGEPINVEDALNELYNNIENNDVSVYTELFSFSGVTSSGSSSTYITKSYTYTKEDIENKYKYLIFVVDGGGATNLMYDQISNLDITNNIAIVNSATAFGNTLDSSLSLYIINTSDLKENDLIFSITFRGLFIIKLIGVK